MVILGIDPGLKATGYGFINLERKEVKLVETGAIEPKQKDLFENRLLKIYILLDELVAKYKPSVIVLEKLYAHHKHPTTASIMGHVRGVICLVSAKNKIQLFEHSVKRIRKAVTGNGNASKLQTQRVVCQMLNIDNSQLTLDASDALALAIGYARMNS